MYNVMMVYCVDRCMPVFLLTFELRHTNASSRDNSKCVAKHWQITKQINNEIMNWYHQQEYKHWKRFLRFFFNEIPVVVAVRFNC